MTIKNKQILKQFGSAFFEKGRVRAHQLITPIDSITEITVKPMTLAQQLNLGDEIDEDEIMSLMTGVTEDVLRRLKTPDWNVIVGHVNDLRQKTSYELAKRRYQPKEMKVAVLFADEPYFVDFELPSVGLSRSLNKEKDTNKRLALYLTNLTTMSKAQIDALSVPDYNMLDGVVADFLSQKADYFQ